MNKSVAASYLGSLLSLGTATCCILPVALMLIGVGGSGLALFAPAAAAAAYVLPASTLVLGLAWTAAWRRGSLRRLVWKLSGSTVLMALAWGVFTLRQPLSDLLIGFL